MKKYIAYLKQWNEGCDYTIACGETVISIEALNWNEAEKKLFEIIEEEYTEERSLEVCELFEINQSKLCNVKDFYDNIKKWQLAEEGRLEIEKEKKELKRLEDKYKK